MKAKLTKSQKEAIAKNKWRERVVREAEICLAAQRKWSW